MAAAAEVCRSGRPDRNDDGEQPLRFVRLTDLAQQLPARQLNTLLGLLKFCWSAPRCWPSQKTLAELRRCSVGTINRGLRELVAAGVIRKRYQRIGRKSPCVYEIAPGYWLPTPKKARVSATYSRSRTEVDSTCKENTPPVAPREAGGEPEPVNQEDGREGAGIEREAIEATPNPAPGDGSGAPAAATDAPAVSTRRTLYRQPRAPRKARRKRRRQIISEMITIGHELVDEMFPPPAREALPRPAIEILPPAPPVPLTRDDDLPRPLTKLWEGFIDGAIEWLAERHQADHYDDRGPARPILDRRRVA